jgi:hypothetical protein
MPRSSGSEDGEAPPETLGLLVVAPDGDGPLLDVPLDTLPEPETPVPLETAPEADVSPAGLSADTLPETDGPLLGRSLDTRPEPEPP